MQGEGVGRSKGNEERVGEDVFRAYGTPGGGIPDPMGKAFEGLLGEIENHRLRLEALEEEPHRATGAPLREADESKSDESKSDELT